jgi:serine/threonine-protein kinase
MPERCPRCSAELANEANYCARCGAFVSTPTPASPGDALIGSVVLGRYRVVRLLGEGGMGKVYLAEQSMGQATRPVALKTLRRELTGDPKLSGRFMRESEIVIRLAHPNTIQFYDFGQLDDGTMVIVMEYIEGRTLAEALRSGPLPLARIDALMTQICGSLAEAHAHGIVHRDLKPQNVLLTTRAGREDFVKVVDFGIALRRSEEDQDPTRLTTHGTLVGTPPYMSPEQFQDRDVDARSDVYSLGVMLYRMLTGELPFEAKNAWQWAAAHIDQPPRPITEHAATRALPAPRAAAVMRALAKNPEDRPRDAAELLRDFAGVAVAEAAAAAPLPDAGARPADPPAADADAAATGPTLHAGEALPSAPGSWLAWLPVALLIAAGGVVTWRSADSAPLPEQGAGVRAAARESARRVAPRSRNSPPRASSAAVPAAAPVADAGARAPLAIDAGPRAELGEATAVAPPDSEATLVALRSALAAGELSQAMAAFAKAQRSLGPDHSEVKRLETPMTELALSAVRTLASRGECVPLDELATRLSSAGIGDAAEIARLAAGCQGARNSQADAAQNSDKPE